MTTEPVEVVVLHAGADPVDPSGNWYGWTLGCRTR